MAMTENHTVPFGALTVHRAVSSIESLVERFRRWQEVRRTVRILSSLDNDQLEDLGLNRADIEKFAAKGRF